MNAPLRVIEVQPGILAFWQGRDGIRFAEGPNWVDDGALSLGIASYALIAGDRAIIYDSHVSPAHGRAIRAELERRGVRQMTLVLSHWHLDHVAGSEAFADCEIIANPRTLAHLTAHKAGIEEGSFHGAPAIRPLILPDRIFDGRLALQLGHEQVELLTANIHSDDATVIWLPGRRVLLAGDTVEDCVTWVSEPEAFDTHLADLARLAALRPERVLPNHGSPEVIAAGGYGPGLLTATADYIRRLRRSGGDPGLGMAEAMAPHLQNGALHWFAPYEAVHAQNLARVAALR